MARVSLGSSPIIRPNLSSILSHSLSWDSSLEAAETQSLVVFLQGKFRIPDFLARKGERNWIAEKEVELAVVLRVNLSMADEIR